MFLLSLLDRNEKIMLSDENGAKKSFVFQKCQKMFWSLQEQSDSGSTQFAQICLSGNSVSLWYAQFAFTKNFHLLSFSVWDQCSFFMPPTLKKLTGHVGFIKNRAC